MERYQENFAVPLERFCEWTFRWLKYILEIITYDTGKSQILMITENGTCFLITMFESTQKTPQ